MATARGAGGVGIVRVSGPDAWAVCAPLVAVVDPEPRRAYFSGLRDRAGQLLDQGLVLFFRAPHSFTGEDVVELHSHGGPRLLQLLLEGTLGDDRVRLAEPGEFTRRAFLNGRIDLARAEAIADLVAADSEAAVRAAAAQARGELSERLQQLRRPLLALHADLEAVLNFPDEAEGAEADAAGRLAQLARSIAALLENASQGALLRRSARVVLFGPVNAGKSTLFNRLLGEARALVDPEPGTTRDVLEGRLELGGLAVALQDTAGLRTAAERIEALGIARARAAIRAADLCVLVLPPDAADSDALSWERESDRAPVLRVRGKADQLPSDAVFRGELRVSSETGEGVEALKSALLERLWTGGAPGAVASVSERHADALRRALEAVHRAVRAAETSTLEAVAGEVGLAAEAIGEITGESASAAMLDEIFRRFCVGK